MENPILVLRELFRLTTKRLQGVSLLQRSSGGTQTQGTDRVLKASTRFKRGDVVVKSVLPIAMHQRHCNNGDKFEIFSPCNEAGEILDEEALQMLREMDYFDVRMKRDTLLLDAKLMGDTTGRSSEYLPLLAKLAFRVQFESNKGFNNTSYLLSQLCFPSNSPQLSYEPLVRSNSKSKSDIPDAEEDVYKELQRVLKTKTIGHENLSVHKWIERHYFMLGLNVLRVPGGDNSDGSSGNKLALYGLVSMLNHSCSPSCGLEFVNSNSDKQIEVVDDKQSACLNIFLTDL